MDIPEDDDPTFGVDGCETEGTDCFGEAAGTDMSLLSSPFVSPVLTDSKHE